MRFEFFLMRYKPLLLRCCMAGLFFVCTGIGLSWMSSLFLSVRDYDLVVADDTPMQMRGALSQIVRGVLSENKSSISGLATHLQDYFPAIRQAFVMLVPRNRAIVQVALHEPLCQINAFHALLKNGSIVPISFIPDAQREHLPVVDVRDWYTEKGDIPEQLPQALTALGESLFDRYEVTWYGDHEVLLTDREVPTFGILFDSGSIPNEMHFFHCAQLKSLLAGRGVLNTPSKRKWVADVRFADQIIVFSDKGDMDYGTSFL